MFPKSPSETLGYAARKAKLAIKGILPSKLSPQPQSPKIEPCTPCRACEMVGGRRGKILIDPLRFHPVYMSPVEDDSRSQSWEVIGGEEVSREVWEADDYVSNRLRSLLQEHFYDGKEDAELVDLPQQLKRNLG
ncbi:hypothetical protein GGR51DRAFT_480706 [Nemania sp. FL0031]|nr:hypothetical protein GGR51DRAFT_480706 [Nemania sp. FL0031]